MLFHKYVGNPILSPNPKESWESFCVLNPAVIYDDKNRKFVMFYRAAGEDYEHKITLGLAESEDGYHFTRMAKDPVFPLHPDEPDGGTIEDPRLVQIGERYYMVYASKTWFVGRYWLKSEERYSHGVERANEPEGVPLFARENNSVSYLALSNDLAHWKRCGRISDSRFDDRDNVIFPGKVAGKYWKLSRPYCDGDHPSIWISSSSDLMEWPAAEKFYAYGQEDWETDRVGAGCPPILTELGWLLIYHGISKVDHCYRIGLMLLDKDDPRRILKKTTHPVMVPDQPYEHSPIYDGCVFPTGVVLRGDTLFIYYGCGDKFVSLATASLKETLDLLMNEPDYTKKN